MGQASMTVFSGDGAWGEPAGEALRAAVSGDRVATAEQFKRIHPNDLIRAVLAWVDTIIQVTGSRWCGHENCMPSVRVLDEQHNVVPLVLVDDMDRVAMRLIIARVRHDEDGFRNLVDGVIEEGGGLGSEGGLRQFVDLAVTVLLMAADVLADMVEQGRLVIEE